MGIRRLPCFEQRSRVAEEQREKKFFLCYAGMSVETTRESRASGMALQTSGRESEKIHTTLTKTVFSKIVQQHSSQVSSSFQACTCLKFFYNVFFFYFSFRRKLLNDLWIGKGRVHSSVVDRRVSSRRGRLWNSLYYSRHIKAFLVNFGLFPLLLRTLQIVKKFLFSDLDGIFRQKSNNNFQAEI